MVSLLLQWGTYNIENVFQDLEYYGFYDYILPFLLIFSLVYVILINLPVFKKEDNKVEKGPAVIIALAIGLLALRFDFVTSFFGEFFPRVGVGLSILIVAMILIGAFINTQNNQKLFQYIFLAIGGIVFLFTLIPTLSNFNLSGYGFWDQYGGAIIVIIILIGAIIAVVKGSEASGKS